MRQRGSKSSDQKIAVFASSLPAERRALIEQISRDLLVARERRGERRARLLGFRRVARAIAGQGRICRMVAIMRRRRVALIEGE